MLVHLFRHKLHMFQEGKVLTWNLLPNYFIHAMLMNAKEQAARARHRLVSISADTAAIVVMRRDKVIIKEKQEFMAVDMEEGASRTETGVRPGGLMKKVVPRTFEIKKKLLRRVKWSNVIVRGRKHDVNLLFEKQIFYNRLQWVLGSGHCLHSWRAWTRETSSLKHLLTN